MQTFKQFLNESSTRIKKIDVDAFIRWADANASEFLKGDQMIFRGIKLQASGSDVGVMIGNSAGPAPRVSANGAANNYTLWIDGHPSFKNYPKRSASFIAGPSHVAMDFGSLFFVICRDNDKIGKALANDIWWKELMADGLNMIGLNEITRDCFAVLGSLSDDTFNDLKESLHFVTVERLKAIDDIRPRKAHVLKAISLMEDGKFANLYGVWEKLVTPDIFEVTTGAKISHKDIGGEVWIEGECGFIPLDSSYLTDEEQQKILDWLSDKNQKFATRIEKYWDYEKNNK